MTTNDTVTAECRKCGCRWFPRGPFERCPCCLLAERDAAHRKMSEELERSRIAERSSEAVLSMAVARLGGFVEGRPTARINFLQRVDALVKSESDHRKLVEAVVNDRHERKRLVVDIDRRAEADRAVRDALADLNKTKQPPTNRSNSGDDTEVPKCRP